MKVIKILNCTLVVAIIATLVVSCNKAKEKEKQIPPTENITSNYSITKELEGCNVLKLRTESSYPNIVVTRCPNSSTTTEYEVQSGKTHSTVQNVVVDK